jgi:hypothetical protein
VLPSATLTSRLAWRIAVVTIAFAGVALRLSELGSWGLSNDEAWVGLATRVEGSGQFRLALAMTPLGWAALVKLGSVVFGGSALALRSVPFAFGCLGMRAALDAGRRFAGHPLGGVLALAAVAFDPLEIDYARVLKQYTAEAFFCLVAIDRATAFAGRPCRRNLVVLSLVLTLGLLFANSQLFLAPPIFAALVADALVRRDRDAARDLVAAAVVVGLWDAAYYRVLVAPRLPGPADAYWGAQAYVPVDLGPAARLVWERLGWALVPALGPAGYAAAMICLACACLVRRTRAAALALVLLVVEIAALSMLHLLAVSQPRILVFVTTALAAFGAAAVALVVVRAWIRPSVAAVAALGLALLGRDFARAHPWRTLPHVMRVEDAGPLVEEVERERVATDTVLLHQSTLFIFAYYQRATPVLDPLPSISVGYVPRLPDARIVLVNDDNLDERARAAFRTSGRVWFLASRLRPPREARVRAILAARAVPALDHRRPGAFLLLLVPPKPT